MHAASSGVATSKVEGEESKDVAAVVATLRASCEVKSGSEKALKWVFRLMNWNVLVKFTFIVLS